MQLMVVSVFGSLIKNAISSAGAISNTIENSQTALALKEAREKVDKERADARLTVLDTNDTEAVEQYAKSLYQHFDKSALSQDFNALAEGIKEANRAWESFAKATNPDAAERTTNDSDGEIVKAETTEAEKEVTEASDTEIDIESIDTVDETNSTQAEDEVAEPIDPKAIKETLGDRITYNEFSQMDRNSRNALNLNEKGSFIGDNFVQHGYLKLDDFSGLANKDTEGKEDGTYGKSKLKADEFTQAMGTLGFVAEDAKQLDKMLEATQDYLKEKGVEGLENDGKALSTVFAGLALKGEEGGFKPQGIDLEDSKAIDMLKDAQALANNKDLKNVAAANRSNKANEVNQAAFKKYNGEAANSEANSAKLTELGINADKLDQFSGAAYAQGLKDFNKLGDNKFIDQFKDPTNKDAVLNISIGVGSNYNDSNGVYADAARGQEMAALSQLTEERGVNANGLNQLALTVHGREGLDAALDKINEFKAQFMDKGADGQPDPSTYKGPEINLDLGIYGHANGQGEMFLGTAGSEKETLGVNDAKDYMDKIQGITGEDGSANVITWGCNTNQLVDAFAEANTNSENKVGSLTVTGTKTYAQSSASNLGSSDTVTTIKKDEDGKLMTESVITNGVGDHDDTYQIRQATEEYKNSFNQTNEQDLSSQQFSDERKEAAQKIGEKVNELQGSNRNGLDGKDGNGNISAADIAEEKKKNDNE
jgi:hypothetical protein